MALSCKMMCHQPCSTRTAGRGVSARASKAVTVPFAIRSRKALTCKAKLEDQFGDIVVERKVKQAWFEKPCEGFKDIKTRKEADKLLGKPHPKSKYTVVEFYAGWCASCKSIFPNMCKLAAQPEMQAVFDFYKVNIEKEDLQSMVEDYEVQNLPFMIVYDPQGKKAWSQTVSFKRFEVTRNNFKTMSQNVGRQVQLDKDNVLHVV